MTFDMKKLYALLPTVYRIRDIEQGAAESVTLCNCGAGGRAERPGTALTTNS
jgi:hypothetical protein